MSLDLDRSLDKLAMAVAGGRSRRAVLQAGLAVAGAAVLSLLPMRALAASNESCAQFCQQLSPGKLRGKCVEDAAHGKGLCFACGPKGTNTGLCGSTCCPPGTTCKHGQCILTGGGIGGLICPCARGDSDDCVCVLCGSRPDIADSGFICWGATANTLCCTDPLAGTSRCVHPLSDVNDCGGCDLQCAAGEICSNGVCTTATCPPGIACPAGQVCCQFLGPPSGVACYDPATETCDMLRGPCSRTGPGFCGEGFCCPLDTLCMTCPDGHNACCPPGFECTPLLPNFQNLCCPIGTTPSFCPDLQPACCPTGTCRGRDASGAPICA